MNSVNLIGRLTRDVESRTTRDDKPVASIRLAVDRPERDAGAVYVDVVCFGKQADACARYLAKGRQVAVSGRLDYSEWQTQDGARRSKHEVIAQRIEFLDRRRDGKGNEPSDTDVPEEAITF